MNFVAAHMDDPRLRACCRLCAGHPNLFTDFSGLFEDGYEAGWDTLVSQYGAAMREAGCWSQILFGTDFCPPIGLTDIERFDAFLAETVPAEHRKDVYYRNALRALPRLAAYIKES